MASNGKSHFTFLFTVCILLFTLSTLLQFSAAMRPLNGEQWTLKKYLPHIESLQRGPVPPSTGSGCTYIPGGSGNCPLNGKNFAGHVNRASPAFRGTVVDLTAV